MSLSRAEVRIALRERGMKQKTLAMEIVSSEAMLSLWLNGKVDSRNIESALRLWLSTGSHFTSDDLTSYMKGLSAYIDDVAIKKIAAKLNAGAVLSPEDELEVSKVKEQLVVADSNPVVFNKLAFQRLRPTLNVQKGESLSTL
eukprot:m.249762 g.249762  ORF g.249762 m.249762 type:complete len:143 (+) comp16299_c0_seq1:35-463(+)